MQELDTAKPAYDRQALTDESIIRAAEEHGPHLISAFRREVSLQPALLYLLLWNLPKLHTLWLSLWGQKNFLIRSWQADFGPRATLIRIPPSFTVLQTLNITTSDFRGSLSVQQVLPLLLLPSLVDVSLSALANNGWTEEEERDLSSCKGKGNFTALSLVDSGIMLCVLSGVLAIPRAGTLKSLIWNIGLGFTSHYDEINAADAMAALAPLHSSLDILEITTVERDIFFEGTFSTSMGHFTALKHVILSDCSWWFTVDDVDSIGNCLPQSLLGLWFHEAEWGMEGIMVEDALVVAVFSLPSLKTLQIDSDPVVAWPKAIVSACEAKGVSMLSEALLY